MKIDRKYVRLILLTGMVISGVVACTPLADPEITGEELLKHIQYLASDELEGRFPGTTGDGLAADYIRENFEKNGLVLLGEDGYQPISIITEVEMGDSNSFSWSRRNLEAGKDFIPLSFSGSGVVTGDMVFAGYGISINKGDFVFDDYQDLDVEGKIVMVLEGGPEVSEGEEDPFVGYLSQRYKVLNAKDRGAQAVVFVAGARFDEQDELKFTARKEPGAGILVIRLKRQIADELLQIKSLTIEELEADYANIELEGAVVQDGITLQVDLASKETHTQNVVGMLQGPAYPDGSIIVIGAHYDHLGWGGPGTGTRVPDTTAIHYGADDNASGVAAIIELAGKLNNEKESLSATYVFVAFAGEEMGLVGSKYFVENPLISLKQVKAMINLDMVGRLKEDRSLSIGGVGTAAEFRSIIEQANDSLFTLGLSDEGYGPSDHAAFYGKDISVLFISTGAHVDYHTPSDNVTGINVEGITEVVNMTNNLIVAIDRKEKLTYQEAGPKQQASARSRYKVTLGLMPDVTGGSTEGLKVEFVTEGRPAQRAGMKKGDVIVAMNGLPVANIYDYMTRLQTLEEGQVVAVEVMRGEEKVVLLVQL